MKLAPWNCCKALLGVVVLLAVLLALPACDSNVEFRRPGIKWDKLVVMSAVRVVKRTNETADGAIQTYYEPVCRFTTESGDDSPAATDADALALNVLFLGSEKKGSPDKDMSIQPGDIITRKEEGKILQKFVTDSSVKISMFELVFDCVDRLSDSTTGDCSAGIQGDRPSLASVEFNSYGHHSVEGDVGVLFLLDMSGSMQGFVNPSPPYQFKEDTYSKVNEKLPAGFNFHTNGTDPLGARFQALESVIRANLNPEDKMAVVAFAENMYKVVCELEFDDPNEALEECYGVNHSLVVGEQDPVSDAGVASSKLIKLQGQERGRTPLWYALDRAYEFMRAQDETFRHVVVITDGPDTCSDSAHLNQCSGECGQNKLEFEKFRESILKTPDGNPVFWKDRLPIHFVQLGAKGYVERDPRQQEIACLTGGQFVFINAHQIPSANLQDVIVTTLRNLMYTVRGFWQFNIPYESVSTSTKPSTGWLYGIEGSGKVMPGTTKLLVGAEQVFTYAFGEWGVSTFDGRVSIRKPCDPDSNECEATGAVGCQTDQDCPGSVARFCDTKSNKCVECFEDADCAEEGACNKTTKACIYSCRVPVAWCDNEALTCQRGFEYEANGGKSDCGDEKAKVSVLVEIEGQPEEYEDIPLGKLPTLCCGGRCLPPDPPKIASDFRYPPGSGKVCFQYDEVSGWTREFKDDPNSSWVYYGELKAGAGPDCSLNKLKEKMQYAVGTFDFDKHWSCAGTSLNCYQPPGSEVVCDPPCADGEKCAGGQCVEEPVDVDVCDPACEDGFNCVGGQCVDETAGEDVCDPACEDGFECVDGQCIDETAGEGVCDPACEDGFKCVDGQCVAE